MRPFSLLKLMLTPMTHESRSPSMAIDSPTSESMDPRFTTPAVGKQSAMYHPSSNTPLLRLETPRRRLPPRPASLSRLHVLLLTLSIFVSFLFFFVRPPLSRLHVQQQHVDTPPRRETFRKPADASNTLKTEFWTYNQARLPTFHCVPPFNCVARIVINTGGSVSTVSAGYGMYALQGKHTVSDAIKQKLRTIPDKLALEYATELLRALGSNPKCDEVLNTTLVAKAISSAAGIVAGLCNVVDDLCMKELMIATC